MRLNQFQIDTIRNLAKKHFGNDSTVYLFGSRTNDDLKGGDIDLFISNGNETGLTIDAKIHFLAELKTKIGDRKIDVVFDNANTRQKKNFYCSVNLHKVEL
ncbi:MAG TPA: nucleotidyltransferase domain-containing protein [Draconibacterium sp.]|nr:nucleotidyltransferase domain-containing protein [Draconibacterium sp.]